MDELYETYIKHFMNDGFLVPHFTIERPLYRYRSNIDYIVNEVENDHVYMSSIGKLNDPFDSSFSISFNEALNYTTTLEEHLLRCYFLHSEKWFKLVKSNLSTQAGKEFTLICFSELLEKEIKIAGGYYPASAIAKNYYKLSLPNNQQRIGYGNVTCFSETWESIPMWSYYAASHKGVCLKYDFNLLDREDPFYKNILTSLQKVWYSQHRPYDKDGRFSPFIKGLQWAHEQEWRLFREFGSEYVSLPCLTELYLGVNFDFSNLDRIINAVKKSPRCINVFMMHPNPDTYGFHRIPLDYD